MPTLYLPAPTFIFLGNNKSNYHLTTFITFLTGVDHHKEVTTYLSGLMANFSLKVDVGRDLFCLPLPTLEASNGMCDTCVGKLYTVKV